MLALGFTVSCGSDEDAGKGAEENALTNGKDDSFFRPTEHGTIQFGLENEARLTDDAQFHAWTFELSGEAAVSLQTNVSQNLDTVMYLYKRDSEDDSWGSYLKKNDDHAGNIYSKIEIDGEAGQYRVIVKGFKKALRGSFSLSGECSGDGCEVEGGTDPGECTNGEYELKGSWTQWTESCNTKVLGVLGSELESSTSGSVPATNHCSASGVVQLGVSGYIGFWEGYDLEYVFYDGLEEAEVNFDYEKRENGHVISLDAGGDEDGLTIILDNDLNTLATYQHNQSPIVDFYCGEDGEEAEENAPHEGCFSDIMYYYPTENAEASTNESGEGSLDDVAALSFAGVGEAVEDFTSHFGVEGGEPVEYSVEEFADALRVYIESTDNGEYYATYTLIPDYRGFIVIREAADSEIICN